MQELDKCFGRLKTFADTINKANERVKRIDKLKSETLFVQATHNRDASSSNTDHIDAEAEPSRNKTHHNLKRRRSLSYEEPVYSYSKRAKMKENDEVSKSNESNIQPSPPSSLSGEKLSTSSRTIEEDLISIESHSTVMSTFQSNSDESKNLEAFAANIISNFSTLIAIDSLMDDLEDKKTKKASKDDYIPKKVRTLDYFSNSFPCFRISWKGYGEADDTWEPLHNVCHLKIYREFMKRRMNQYHSRISELIKRIHSADNVALPILSRDLIFENVQQFHPYQLYTDLVMLAVMDANRKRRLASYQTIFNRCRKNLYILPYYSQRRYQSYVLLNWAKRINAIDTDHELTVVNDVDFDLPPLKFTYITEVRPTEGIEISTEPPIGCDCGPQGCTYRSNCCGRAQDASMAYNKNGTLRITRNVAIFECNKRCTCGPKCMNRVVQHGSNHKLCIFKTSNGRGWGVRTKRKIKQGRFICEYVGEIIDSEEAEERDKEYVTTGGTYVFDLDFNSNDNPYSVDATHFGNVSHFINHSCEPNAAIWPVWINCLNLDLPKICLFALKDIDVDEEITFDYTNFVPDNESAASTGLTARHSEVSDCLCGSTNCRKILFHFVVPDN